MRMEHSVVIERPIDEVFELATCLRRCVIWRSALLTSTKTSDGPVGVGTTFDQDVRMLGKTRTNTAVITEYEPPRRFVYRHVNGLSDYQARFLFEPVGNGTRFTVDLEGEPTSLWLKVVPESLVVWQIRDTIAAEMDTLKAMMESEVDLEAALAAE